MSKGKSQFATWRCTGCQKPHHVTYYDKRRDAEIVKELPMFCNSEKCGRQHVMHVRKDTKKGNN